MAMDWCLPFRRRGVAANGGRRGTGALAAAAMLLLTGPVTADEDAVEVSNRRCFNCHGQLHIAELLPKERASMVQAGTVSKWSIAA